MTHRLGAIFIALAVLLLAGCQNVPGVPDHKYYRLQALAATAPESRADAVLLHGELSVRPLRGEGPYSERAIVFSDAQQRTLQQYHYHHWLYPPEQMVQEHLAERLRQTEIATTVRLMERGSEAQYAVSGRILRFDRITASPAMAAATLELRLEKKGRELWRRTYAVETAVSDGSMTAFAAAMEIALNRICGEFVDDLRRIKPE